MSITQTNTYLNKQLRSIHVATEEGNNQLAGYYQYDLGLAYTEGKEKLTPNLKLGFIWFEKAAKNGHIEAMLKLVKAYTKGIGVEEDSRLARQWNAEADYGIGNTYAYGIGVKKDDYLASQWYQKAADKGHAEAQCKLATLYTFDDRGVERNYFLAEKWYIAAANQSHMGAARALEKLYLQGLRKRPEPSFKNTTKPFSSTPGFDQHRRVNPGNSSTHPVTRIPGAGFSREWL